MQISLKDLLIPSLFAARLKGFIVLPPAVLEISINKRINPTEIIF